MTLHPKSIRVGLIRCDRRALWYGAIFDAINPEVYAAMDPLAYHHMTWYHLVELANKRAKGFRLTRIYDADPAAAAQFARAFDGRPKVCERLDEVSEDVDLVFIANASGDGGDHPSLAAPGLRRGVPTFIDRPLAASVREAKALLRLAQRHGAPVLSCSHLRLLPHAIRFKRRFDELDGIDRAVVQGHGPHPADAADGIDLGLALFREELGGRISGVHATGGHPLELVLMSFNSAKDKARRWLLVVNSHMAGPRHAFHVSVNSDFHQISLDDLEAAVQSEGGLGVMEALREMIRTGKSPLRDAEMIETVAVMEAARRVHGKARAGALPR